MNNILKESHFEEKNILQQSQDVYDCLNKCIDAIVKDLYYEEEKTDFLNTNLLINFADENSRDSDQSSRNSDRKRYSRTSMKKEMNQIGNVSRILSAEEVIEYEWPPHSNNHFFLQEQISDYLNCLSFRRKYPDLSRRNIKPLERNYVLDKGLVNETQSDLGLTPLKSDEVIELMEKDYPDQCKELAKVLQERDQKKMLENVKSSLAVHKPIDKSKLQQIRKKALKGVSNFNSNLLKKRNRERKAYFDLQTMQVHFPQIKRKPMENVSQSPYPVALMSGQYADYYKTFTLEQLKCLPINTALKLPPTPPPEVDEKIIFSDSESSVNESDTEIPCNNNQENKIKKEPIVEEETKQKNAVSVTPAPSLKQTPVSFRGRKRKRGSSIFSTNVKIPKPKGRPPGSTSKKKVTTPIRGRGAGGGRGGRRGRPPKNLSLTRNQIPPLKLNLSVCLPRIQIPQMSDVCSICHGDSNKNKEGKPEEFVRCADCDKTGHPSCYEITDMLLEIRKYKWQCMECKACAFCKSTRDEESMIFCDHCDRGFHTFCLGIPTIPSGSWQCPKCKSTSEIESENDDNEKEKNERQSIKTRKIIMKKNNHNENTYTLKQENDSD